MERSLVKMLHHDWREYTDLLYYSWGKKKNIYPQTWDLYTTANDLQPGRVLPLKIEFSLCSIVFQNITVSIFKEACCQSWTLCSSSRTPSLQRWCSPPPMMPCCAVNTQTPDGKQLLPVKRPDGRWRLQMRTNQQQRGPDLGFSHLPHRTDDLTMLRHHSRETEQSQWLNVWQPFWSIPEQGDTRYFGQS